MIDRTEIFLSLERELRGAAVTPTAEASSVETKQKKDERFKLGTNFVSRELEGMERQIELFVKETKSRSLYEDSGAAIAAGTEKIKAKLDVLSKTIAQLSSFVHTAAASRQQREHRVVVVNTLKNRFAKLTKEFKDNLQKRTNALASRQARQMQQFGASTVQLSTRNKQKPKLQVFNPARSRFPPKHGPINASVNATNPSNSSNNQQQQVTPKPFIAPVPPPAPTYAMTSPPGAGGMGVRRRVNMGDGGGVGTMQQEAADPYDNDKLHKPQLQVYDRSHKQARRAVHVKQAESLISELSTMLGEVATMVVEQGEDVELIDSNLEESTRQITIGNTELLKYYNNLSKERQLILKILAVVLFLGILFLIMFRR